MRILYLSRTALHGGAEEVLLRFMRAGQTLGHEPVLGIPGPGWLAEEASRMGVRWLSFAGIPDYAPTAWAQFRHWPANSLAIARAVRRDRIDMVHSNSPRVAYHGGLGARLAGAASVVHVHDISDLPYAGRAKATLLRRLSDATIAVSDAVRAALLASPCPPRLVRRIYNGLDPDAYRDVSAVDIRAQCGWPADFRVIGNVSAMTPWKGQDVLIQAFARYAAHDGRCGLVIVGSARPEPAHQRHEAALHALARSRGLAGRVCFAGWREDALAWIKAMDLFIHVPVQPDPLPTVLLHAAALGVPVIASAIGGIPEIVLDGVTGRLVPPGAADPLAAAIHALLADPGACRCAAEAGRQHYARCFGWEPMVQGLAEVYNAVTAGRRSMR